MLTQSIDKSFFIGPLSKNNAIHHDPLTLNEFSKSFFPNKNILLIKVSVFANIFALMGYVLL